MICQLCKVENLESLYHNYDRMYRKKDFMYAVLRCENCGLIQLDVKREIGTISQFYPAELYYSYQKQDTRLKAKVHLYKALFASNSLMIRFIAFPLRQMMRGVLIRPGIKVLDIGSGSGKFMEIISQLGMKPYGVEISPSAYQKSKQISEDVYLGGFEQFDKNYFEDAKEGFDLIVSNHVVEHAISPIDFMKNVSSSLKKDGLAIIATPNTDSIWAHIFKKYWSQLDSPRHLQLFSPYNFDILADMSGLKIVKVRYLSNEFGVMGSLIYIVEDLLARKLPGKLSALLIRSCKLILLPLYTIVNLAKLGDTVEYQMVKK